MALLNAKWARAAALGAGVALVGCVLAESLRPERRFAFSHELHVEGEGLDCFSCHETALMEDDPGMPALDGCLACHDALDAEKDEGRRVASLFEGERFRAARVSALADELVFSHALHAQALEDCSACHAGVASSRAVGPGRALAMDDCTDCHAARGAPNDCADCHREVDAGWEPASHRRDWRKAHGPTSRGPAVATADDCGLCHTEATCVRCHLQEPPDDHHNHFRRRGHGLLAMLDRETCAACHRSDACDRCHQEVRPMNHVGSWGGTLSNHCLTCHFPLQAEACSTCHKATPSHLATPKPPGHHPAMNCRQCHGVTEALPHAEKGDNCNLCHP
jgi:hypothetical protein